MKPEDVPQEWVEKAVDGLRRAVDSDQKEHGMVSCLSEICSLPPCACLNKLATNALAAVIPLIQAHAYEHAATIAERTGWSANTDGRCKNSCPCESLGEDIADSIREKKGGTGTFLREKGART